MFVFGKSGTRDEARYLFRSVPLRPRITLINLHSPSDTHVTYSLRSREFAVERWPICKLHIPHSASGRKVGTDHRKRRAANSVVFRLGSRYYLGQLHIQKIAEDPNPIPNKSYKIRVKFSEKRGSRTRLEFNNAFFVVLFYRSEKCCTYQIVEPINLNTNEILNDTKNKQFIKSWNISLVQRAI